MKELINRLNVFLSDLQWNSIIFNYSIFINNDLSINLEFKIRDDKHDILDIEEIFEEFSWGLNEEIDFKLEYDVSFPSGYSSIIGKILMLNK